MKKGCLITLVVAGLIGIAGIVGITFVFKKAKGVVEDLATGVGVSPEVTRKVRSLNNRYPFDIPADNSITEQQVTSFIAIKKEFAQRVKQHELDLRDLEKHAGKKTGFGDVADAYRIIADIRRDFLDSLRDHEMSPKEYMFLTGQVYSGYFSEAVRTGVEQARTGMEKASTVYHEQLAELDRQLQDPNTPDAARAGIEQARKSVELAMAGLEKSRVGIEEAHDEIPRQNLELLDKYRDELLRLDTAGFEYWGLATMIH